MLNTERPTRKGLLFLPRANPRQIHAIPTPAGVFCKHGKAGPRIGLDLRTLLGRGPFASFLTTRNPRQNHAALNEMFWSILGPWIPGPIDPQFRALMEWSSFPRAKPRQNHAIPTPAGVSVTWGWNWTAGVRFFPYRVKKICPIYYR